MKHLNTILISLAFLGLSMSSIWAQSTYIITGSGTQFSAFKDGAVVPGANDKPIQTVINAIKVDAARADCTIQFGTGTSTLDIGASMIDFDGGFATGKDWGLVTLTGKLTTACSGGKGAIYLLFGASVNSKADITNTIASGTTNATFRNDSYGRLTISGGTVSLTNASGMAIYNTSNGEVHITGGVVEARGENEIAVYSIAEGKVTVSGDAVITSCNTSETTPCTIFITGSEGASGTCLEITGGTIENTANGGVAICNDSFGAINISGGTISATGDYGSAIANVYLLKNVSGGTVSATGNYSNAIVNRSNGEINISGGTISATGEKSAAISNSRFKTINISGGTVSVTGEKSAAINNWQGTTTISGGTVSATGDENAAISNGHMGALTISGGTVSATAGWAVLNRDGIVTISGGMFLATTGYAVGNYAGEAIPGGTVLATIIPITISGGILFAYGEDETDVIDGDYDMSGNAAIVAWNEAAGTTTYNAGTSDDIYKLPTTATAVWAKQGDDSGIAVANEENIGFIALPVTITGVNIVETRLIASVQVYPNPTKGEFWVSGFEVSGFELQVTGIEIFDVMGRTVGANLRVCPETNTINISHLPSGIYFLKITTKNGVITKKIIKN